MAFLSLIAAVILLVLDINDAVSLSYWVIAGIGFASLILWIAAWAVGDTVRIARWAYVVGRAK